CFPLSLFRRYLRYTLQYGCASHPGRTEEPSHGAIPLARLAPGRLPHRLGDPVDHDRQKQDADPGDHTPAVVVAEPPQHLEPEPAPPINAAMITTESTIMIVWFTPRRIEGLARGSCTLRSTWPFVAPNATAASTRSAD